MNIQVVFAVNNSYVKQLATVITSILNHSSENNVYQFYVLTNDIEISNQKKMHSYIKTFKNAKLEFIDMQKIIENFDLEKLMSRREDYNYISIETYFRFFIPTIFKDCEKILYLDADILVLKDLEILFNENIEDYYCAAVNDTYVEKLLDKTSLKTALQLTPVPKEDKDISEKNKLPLLSGAVLYIYSSSTNSSS